MCAAEPEKYAVTITVRVSEEERQNLKILAAKEKQTLKALLFEALDKAFPGWRDVNSKLS